MFSLSIAAAVLLDGILVPCVPVPGFDYPPSGQQVAESPEPSCTLLGLSCLDILAV